MAPGNDNSTDSSHDGNRLAAMLSADAVGYSRLMADDATETIRTITAYREEIGALVRKHGGRVTDVPGDNILAEFPTATGALQAALEIQPTLGVLNSRLRGHRRMDFRIGIHVGEVRVEDGNIYGDGVNIAARLEGLAEPGGICVSAAVREQTHSAMDYACEDLGSRELKNIPEPIHVFRVRPYGSKSGHATAAPRGAAAGNRSGLTLGLSVAFLLVVALVGGRWWLNGEHRATESTAEEPASSGTAERFTVPGFAGRPAIAVLPFDNLSGDPQQEYFADGIAEDLITRLSLWRSFPVIARNSSFAFKGESVDVKEVSRVLGARYIVEGSVRRSQDDVRITAQLIDATTGHHVWARTYDRKLKDVFAVQDEISTAIAASTQGELNRVEQRRAMRSEPSNLKAWDLVAKAMWHMGRYSAEDNAKALALAEQALKLEPHSALALGALGWVHYFDVFNQWGHSPEQSLQAMIDYARRSVEMDPGDAWTQALWAVAASLLGDGEDMLRTARRAVELNPSLAPGRLMLGWALGGAGQAAEAIAEVEIALRLSPRDEHLWAAYDTLSLVHFWAGNQQKAIQAERKALQLRPQYAFGYISLGACYGSLGQIDAGRAALDEALRLQPNLTMKFILSQYVFAKPELLEQVETALVRAGWVDP